MKYPFAPPRPGTLRATGPLLVFIDADACPVKDEVYKVAARHGLKTYVVANAFLNVPREANIERVVVAAGPDVADDWIVERCGAGSVVVTGDIPLASRAIKAGATVISGTALVALTITFWHEHGPIVALGLGAIFSAAGSLFSFLRLVPDTNTTESAQTNDA